jgi:hypothetical protein
MPSHQSSCSVRSLPLCGRDKPSAAQPIERRAKDAEDAAFHSVGKGAERFSRCGACCLGNSGESGAQPAHHFPRESDE